MSLEPEILEAKPLPDGTYYVQYAGWRDETRKAQGRGDQQFRRPDGGVITADLVTDHRIQIPPIGRAIFTRIDRASGREQGFHIASRRWVYLDTYSGPVAALQYREWQIDVQTEFVLPAMERFAARTRAIDKWGDRRGTTLNLIVTQSLDDIHEFEDPGTIGNGAAVWMNSNTLAIGRTHGLMRFTGATVPQGATINAASLTVQCLTTVVDDPNGTMYCEDADEAAIGSTTDFDVTGRAKTTANTPWVATGLGVSDVSLDMTSAVQEVVDRAGFTETAIACIWQPNSDFTSAFRVRAYDGSTTLCARLDIDYTAAATVGSPWNYYAQQ